MRTFRRMEKRSAKEVCPACDYVLTLSGSDHARVPATRERCKCGALLVRICRIGPGHEVVRCAAGCVSHDIEKLFQPCPHCGNEMLISESHTTRRYVYRCRANPGHVKIEPTCAEPGGRAERVFLTARRAR